MIENVDWINERYETTTSNDRNHCDYCYSLVKWMQSSE